MAVHVTYSASLIANGPLGRRRDKMATKKVGIASMQLNLKRFASNYFSKQDKMNSLSVGWSLWQQVPHGTGSPSRRRDELR